MAHMKMKKYHGLGGMMRINMGKPVYAGRERNGSGVQGEMVNAHLKFHGNDYNAVCLSVGNPNCVFMMEEVAPRKAEGAEPYVNRMNMQLCKVADRENIVMEVYDRGQGIGWRLGWEPAQRRQRQGGWGWQTELLRYTCKAGR